jgi:Fungal specific transcription factor domain
MYPTLHEPTFRQDLEAVYSGSTDPYQNFVLRIVLAISMQKLVTQYAGLADSYYLAALPFLDDVVKPMDLKTIQCLVLIAQYSLLTPTKIPVYYLIGLVTRMCQQLGLNEEKTVVQGVTELDPIQKDMRRRLFWIVTNMENGLSHSLGRPSAFAISADHLEVGFFETVDDEYITTDGIKPGPPSPKKIITIHFFKMRLLQMEIRKKLYLKVKPEPRDDQDPWFSQMEGKLNYWRTTSPGNDGGTGLSSVWFDHPLLYPLKLNR